MAKMDKARNNMCWRGCGERGTPLSCVGNASWYSHFGKQCGGSQKVKIELPYDPAFALLVTYHKGTDVVKTRGICTPMYPATKSTIAQLWKEPWCPSRNEWIKNMWSIYTMEYYSVITTDEYPRFSSTWMKHEGIIPCEISQAEKKQLSHDFIYMWNIRNRMEDVRRMKSKMKGWNQKVRWTMSDYGLWERNWGF